MKKTRSFGEALGALSLPLYGSVLVCLDLAFRYLYRSGAAPWQGVTPLLFTLGWVLMMTGTAGLLPRRGGRVWMVATVVFWCLLVLVHCVMSNLFGKFFSLEDLLYAGEGARFFSFQYIKVRCSMVACLILALVGGLLAARLLKKPQKRGRRWLAALAGVLGLVLVLGLHNNHLVDLSADVMTWSVATDSDNSNRKRIYTEFSNPNASLSLTGLYHYTGRNTLLTLLPEDTGSREEALRELDAWYDSRTVEADPTTGILEGDNCIMVMLESIDSFLVTPDFMPNLYALQQQSVNFTNFYTPLYLTAGTFGTEFLSQTGLIPPQTGVSTSAYAQNSFPLSLANLFRRQGYTANSFHAASPIIYNRGSIHENLGFQAYHSHVELGMEDYMRDSQLLNGIDKMISGEPFYSYIITYSGHGPYDPSMANISAPHLEAATAAVEAAGLEGSAENLRELTLAVAHAMETDAFIGGLMAELEEAGLLENTTVIFYADHYCKYMTDPEFLMELKGVDNRNLLCRTPFLIYSRKLEPGQRHNLTSSPDLYPTVCTLFGLNTELRYMPGQNVFDGADHLVFWPDYSWYDGTTYVDGGQTRLTQEQAQTGTTVRQILQRAWDTVIWDYFRDRPPAQS